MLKVIDSAVPVACWSCNVAHNASTLFCPHCSKIQPAAAGDYFSVFSLVPKLDLDLGMLEHQFHKLSRKLHPDRFARASHSEKEWSLADTALLNDAYARRRRSQAAASRGAMSLAKSSRSHNARKRSVGVRARLISICRNIA